MEEKKLDSLLHLGSTVREITNLQSVSKVPRWESLVTYFPTLVSTNLDISVRCMVSRLKKCPPLENPATGESTVWCFPGGMIL